MTTVREASYELLRSRGMTTFFGNPGSTELAFLQDFPDDFDYVLGLQESVVVAMADGFAQISGAPTLVNLHTSPGVGHGMGAMFNAKANKSPLVVTAGQQARKVMTMEATLTNRDATTVPLPFVKHSYEPPRAQEVPVALARAIHLAEAGPRGPVFLSIPMDDWDAELVEDEFRPALTRSVAGHPAPDPAALRALAERLGAAANPAMVAGADVDARGAWDSAVALAEKLSMVVWSAPLSGRAGFPQDHPAWRGELPPAIGFASETLKEHDLVLVVGAPVFAYYPYVPGPFLAEGTSLVHLTDDPEEAGRAPMGDALLGDVAHGLAALAEMVGDAGRPAPEPLARPEEPEAQSPLLAGSVFSALNEVLPDDAIVSLESPSNTLIFRQHVRIARPGSYLFGAGGGLGFGLPAAVGAGIAARDRPVVAVIGDGSMQYAVQALWSAVAYDVPMTVLVPCNQEYAILKWFSEFEGVEGAPGLDLPALDNLAIASGYGVNARRVESRDELRSALEESFASSTVDLVEVPIKQGMAV